MRARTTRSDFAPNCGYDRAKKTVQKPDGNNLCAYALTMADSPKTCAHGDPEAQEAIQSPPDGERRDTAHGEVIASTVSDEDVEEVHRQVARARRLLARSQSQRRVQQWQVRTRLALDQAHQLDLIS